MITSHETAADFKYFYNSLNKVSADLKINFVYKPERIVSDACEAMHKALTEVYPDIEILMCWFHVKLNVRKHKKLIPDFLYGCVKKVINMMHNCRSREQFDKIVNHYV